MGLRGASGELGRSGAQAHDGAQAVIGCGAACCPRPHHRRRRRLRRLLHPANPGVWRVRELAMLISLTSFGSSQTLRLPHLSTDAARRFCSSSDTPILQRGGRDLDLAASGTLLFALLCASSLGTKALTGSP
jgi:hypothetical protein